MRRLSLWPITRTRGVELNMRLNRNVRNWWRHFVGHLGTLLLSIVMGLIVWLIAVNQENPLLTQDFPSRVAVQVEGMAANLQPTEDLTQHTVRLELQAPQSSWNRLQASEIRAFLDLKGLEAGVHTVPIQVKVDDPEVVVKMREPASLQIQLDQVITKTTPVTVEIMDSPAYGYDWQTPTLRPTTVTVSGPSTQVAQVSMALAQVELRGASSPVQRFQNIILVNEQEQPIPQVTAMPQIVEVVVPIERWPGRREVAVRVNLVGQPASGYRLGAPKVEPSSVVLRGDSDVVNEVPGFVETQPLSVEGATSDVRSRVSLILPLGVTSSEGDMVEVTVSVVPVEDSKRITLKPTLRGVDAGLKASVALDTVDVIVSGPQSILDSLGSDDIFVMLDLDGLLPGNHVLQPRVVIPDDIRLEGVLPETIEVAIVEVATPMPTMPPTPQLQATPTLTSRSPLLRTGQEP